MQLPAKHIHSNDFVMKAGTCIGVLLVQGFNHYCFPFAFKSNRVSVSDSESCDIFTNFIPSIPFDELQSSPGSHKYGRPVLVPSCVSPPPVQDQNRGILPR